MGDGREWDHCRVGGRSPPTATVETKTTRPRHLDAQIVTETADLAAATGDNEPLDVIYRIAVPRSDLNRNETA